MSPAIRVLFDEAAIGRRVGQLAGQIAADHGQEPPVILGIRNGAVPFMMDLLRLLPASWRPDLLFDFLDATSYSGARSTGVRLSGDLVVDLEGRSVLVVDGIVDTGETIREVLRHLRRMGPPGSGSAPSWTSRAAAGSTCRSTTGGSRWRTSSSSAMAWTSTSATAACAASGS